LNYFFLNPHEALYVNEMARLLSLDPGNLIKKLSELEREGILISEFRGHQRYYRLNSDYSFLKEYKAIFAKTFGVESMIKKSFALPGIRQLILFGSYARGEMEPESDVDILVVGDTPHLTLEKSALNLRRHLHREVNVVDFSEEEFRDRMKRKDPFLMDVLKHPHLNLLEHAV